jgi:hypothetical protein
MLSMVVFARMERKVGQECVGVLEAVAEVVETKYSFEISQSVRDSFGGSSLIFDCSRTC